MDLFFQKLGVRWTREGLRKPGAAASLGLLAFCPCLAQQPGPATNAQRSPEPAGSQQPTNEPGTPATLPTTVFAHPDEARWFLSGQANIIFQAHPGFHSPYQGVNSMLPRGEYKTSLVGTLFTGYQLNPHPRFATDLLFNLESAGGRGISEALGLAGFTNLDVVRNPNLGSTPYAARIQLHQVIERSGLEIFGGLAGELRVGIPQAASGSPSVPLQQNEPPRYRPSAMPLATVGIRATDARADQVCRRIR